jgi:hypothetical protein
MKPAAPVMNMRPPMFYPLSNQTILLHDVRDDLEKPFH